MVQQHNGNIASILESFDTITYCKGASVLRMLCHCVGPARFLEGTRRFVVDHQFASATQEDLWKAVQVKRTAVRFLPLSRASSGPSCALARKGRKKRTNINARDRKSRTSYVQTAVNSTCQQFDKKDVLTTKLPRAPTLYLLQIANN